MFNQEKTMITNTTAFAQPPASARTNALHVPLPLHALATALDLYLAKNHSTLQWHWQVAPHHPRATPWEQRLESERQALYTALFGTYDMENAKFLNWRRVSHGGQDWLLCAAMHRPGAISACNAPPTNLSDAACAAWVELQCLWLIVLSKTTASSWSDAFGPGASWFVGLRGNENWASAFKVQTHVVEHQRNATILSVTLTEQAFRQPSTNVLPSNPAARVGLGRGLLAWSNLYLGRKVPLTLRRPIFRPTTKDFWTIKWSYYNSISDALEAALKKAGIAAQVDVFIANHCWTAPKITPENLPAAPTIEVVNLAGIAQGWSTASVKEAIDRANDKAPLPGAAIALQWSVSVPQAHTSVLPTLVVQPSSLAEGETRCCWYIDANGSRQWVSTKEELVLPRMDGCAVDPYSGYKFSIGHGPLAVSPIQAIASSNAHAFAWAKTLRELLIQPWWLSNAPMLFPECLLPPQTFTVWHQTLDKDGRIGLVVLTFEWDAQTLQLKNSTRKRFANKQTFQQHYPLKPLRNGWWLEDEKNNRLEIATEPQHGFVLRGNKHLDTSSLRATIAKTRGPRKAKPGKVQKTVCDEVLSRSAKDQLLPYYTSPWPGVAPHTHKDTVYLQEQGQRLRIFVPPYGPLEALDGFRQFRVVRLWEETKGAYAPWSLSNKTPDLLYWYLRTLTWDLLQVKENSQMCLLEKMARECQIDM